MATADKYTKGDKPIRPKLRGEKWALRGERTVTLLKLLGIDELGQHVFEVLNENGMLESVWERQFQKRLEPPERGEKDEK